MEMKLLKPVFWSLPELAKLKREAAFRFFLQHSKTPKSLLEQPNSQLRFLLLISVSYRIK